MIYVPEKFATTNKKEGSAVQLVASAPTLPERCGGGVAASSKGSRAIN